jgi:hypothetical protein
MPPALERMHQEIARDDVVLSTISDWKISMRARRDGARMVNRPFITSSASA